MSLFDYSLLKEGLWYLEANKFSKALALFNSLESSDLNSEFLKVMSYYRGRIFWQRKAYREAKVAFAFASKAQEKHLANIAKFNEALVWLESGKSLGLNELSKNLVNKGVKINFTLEYALYLAYHRKTEAKANLQQFLEDFSDSPRAKEARVALVFLCLNELPFNLKLAKDQLDFLKESPNLPEPISEKTDLLELRLAELEGNLERLRQKADRFIKHYPNSRFYERIFAKLVEVNYRTGQYYETLFRAKQYLSLSITNSKWRKLIELLAAESASALVTRQSWETSFAYFEQLAEGDDEGLRLYAKYQQAKLLFDFGRYPASKELLKPLLDQIFKMPNLKMEVVTLWAQLLIVDPQESQNSIEKAIDFL